MTRLIRRLPPLKALVAFEAVVRLGSVTAAARELGSTQPSVSQHLRTLEGELGTALLRKRGRTLAATAEGRVYFEAVTESLHRIAEASDRLRMAGALAGRVLTIRANFGFAHLWLLPRLDVLEAAVPGVDLRVDAADGPGEEADGSAELVVYFGPFARARAGDQPLIEEQVVPVCSPEFATNHALTADTPPERLAALALLHMDERDPRWLDWPRWLALAGVSARPRPARIQYRNYPLVLNAAMAGQGLALGWAGLVDALIAGGRLVPVAGPVRRSGWGYLLRVAPDADQTAQAVAGALRAAAGRA